MTIFLETDLNTFSSKISDVAMPNRFIVEITPSEKVENVSSILSSDIKFFCTKAIIPEISIVGPVVNFRGTKQMLSGDPKFGTLVLGFLNANNWRVRNYFEDWLSTIKDYQGIKKNEKINTAKNYVDIPFSDIVVKQIDGGYRVLAQYNFYRAAPLEMSAIDLNVETASANEAFDITFQFSHWFRGIDRNDVDEMGEHEVVEIDNYSEYDGAQ